MRSDPFIASADAAEAVSVPLSDLQREMMTAALRRCLPAGSSMPPAPAGMIAPIPPEAVRKLPPSGLRCVYESHLAPMAHRLARQAAAATHGTAAWWYRMDVWWHPTDPTPAAALPAPRLRPQAAKHSERAAENPGCPPAALMGLCAQHANSGPNSWNQPLERCIRHAAENPACPPSVLAYAAANTRIHPATLARNPNCPQMLLTASANSPDPYERTFAAGNKNLPYEAARLLAVDPAESIRARLGATSAYRDLLTLLACDRSRWVRSSVETNRSFC